MPALVALVAGIHVNLLVVCEDVDGRNKSEQVQP
jgi:hypothetical protein